MLRWQAMTAVVTTRSRRRWTYADYCRIPPDRMRHEIIDGRHYVSPAPSPYHQWVVAQLLHHLMGAVTDAGLGAVYTSPIDVHLGRGTLVQPDIVVLRTANRSLVGDKKITGVPDLLTEVISPSRPHLDRRTKFGRYERAGVREFWLVDPAEHTIEQFVLCGRRYGPPVLCTDRIRLRVLRGIDLDLHRVW